MVQPEPTPAATVRPATGVRRWWGGASPLPTLLLPTGRRGVQPGGLEPVPAPSGAGRTTAVLASTLGHYMQSWFLNVHGTSTHTVPPTARLLLFSPPPCKRCGLRPGTLIVCFFPFFFCETYNLSPSRVSPKECHALQPKQGGSGRMQLAYTGASDYIDQVWHDRHQVSAQATMPLYIPASNRRIDQVYIR